MLTPILVLMRKDMTLFLRNRPAVMLTFVVPFVMIWIFGNVFGLNRRDQGPNGVPLAVVNESDSPAAKAWVEALASEKGLRLIKTVREDGQERPIRESDVRGRIEGGAFNFALVIPRDFEAQGRFGLSARVYSNPRNEVETQIVTGLMQRALFANASSILGGMLQSRTKEFLGAERTDAFNSRIASAVADAWGGNEAEIRARIEKGQYFDFSPAATATGEKKDGAADVFSSILKLDTQQVVGKDVVAPAATRLVSGFAMQFLLFSLSAGAASLLLERDEGIYHRLLSGRVKRHHILIGRFLHGIVLGMTQLTVLFLGSQLLFGVQVVSHLPLLWLVSFFAAAACAAFGMLIASFARTFEAANGVATLVILTMCAVGGAWFPLSMMPDFFQQAARFTLVFWSMRGFDLVLWNQTGVAALVPVLTILGTIATVVMALASWQFSRSRLFE